MTTPSDSTPATGLERKRRWALAGISLLVLLGAAAYAAYATLVLSQREDTDNAYVGGNQVMLTA